MRLQRAMASETAGIFQPIAAFHALAGCEKSQFREGFSSTPTLGCAVSWAFAHPGRGQSRKSHSHEWLCYFFPQPVKHAILEAITTGRERTRQMR